MSASKSLAVPAWIGLSALETFFYGLAGAAVAGEMIVIEVTLGPDMSEVAAVAHKIW